MHHPLKMHSLLKSALLGLLVLTQVGLAAEPVSKLGLSPTKPESGPYVEVGDAYMVPYTFKVPGSEVEIAMVPVQGGTFKLGTSEDADYFSEDEGPQVEVEVGPMWVAKYETTWEQYQLYMSMYKLFKDLQSEGLRKIGDSNKVDAVTAPTELYDPSYTFEYGQGANAASGFDDSVRGQAIHQMAQQVDRFAISAAN